MPLLDLSAPAVARPVGLVVRGETGAGKSFLVRWLARQHPAYTLLEVPSADLVHKEVGASEKAMRELFERGALSS